jgi:Stc1 domain
MILLHNDNISLTHFTIQGDGKQQTTNQTMSIADFYIEHGLNPGDDVCRVLESGYIEIVQDDNDPDDETVAEHHAGDLIYFGMQSGWVQNGIIKNGMLSFRQESTGYLLNFWLTTGTAGSYLEHPKQGKTQLFRRKVTFGEALELFENPRKHTGTGYHETRELKRKRPHNDEPTRYCASCQEHKPLHDFSKNQRRKGDRGRCQDCVAGY